MRRTKPKSRTMRTPDGWHNLRFPPHARTVLCCPLRPRRSCGRHNFPAHAKTPGSARDCRDRGAAACRARCGWRACCFATASSAREVSSGLGVGEVAPTWRSRLEVGSTGARSRKAINPSNPAPTAMAGRSNLFHDRFMRAKENRKGFAARFYSRVSLRGGLVGA
jgi:hypothetical protein